MADDHEHMQDIARYYIINHLRRGGFDDVADQLPPVRGTSHQSYIIIERIVNQLEQERSDQFQDILSGLDIDEGNLNITYKTVVEEIFNGGVHWGRIVAFLVFSGHFAIHCASHGLKEHVPDVMSWAEAEMTLRICQWVEEQGGWGAFVTHFDRWDGESWTTALVTVSMVAALFAAGFFTIKRFFT